MLCPPEFHFIHTGECIILIAEWKQTRLALAIIDLE